MTTGFRFMTEAGYNPKGIVEVMQILGAARQGEAPPEFLSSHPNSMGLKPQHEGRL